MVLVVLQHSCGSVYNSGIHTDSILPRMIEAIGVFHMALFMLISGFLFSFSYYIDGKICTQKLKTQFLNLCLIYTEYSIIRYIFKMIFNDQSNNPIDKWSIVKILYQAIDELWFLYVLIILYMISMLAMQLSWWKQCIALGCIASIIYIISGENLPSSLNRAIQYLLYFNMGVLMREKIDTLKVKADCKYLYLEMVIAVSLYVLYFSECIKMGAVNRILRIMIGCFMSKICVDIAMIIQRMADKKHASDQNRGVLYNYLAVTH